jgi:uncharacterized protein (TIGR00299 family) protein
VIAYVDCFSGASGDMLLGALLDVGLSLEVLQRELAKLSLEGYRLTLETPVRNGLKGSKLNVMLTQDSHTHRHLTDIEALIEGSTLPPSVRARSISTFRRLARAEGKVHGVPPQEVHFHEVGAVDSIVDIAGFVIGLDSLQIEALYSSPLVVGSGTVHTQHGLLPAPAPATLEILAEATIPVRRHPQAETELLTPTAAALLAELAVFSNPSMAVEAVGYGFGTKTFAWPNAVRIWLGLASPSYPEDRDEVILLECNLDDTTGEVLGYAMEQCLAEGALDVWFTGIQMKKNRPGVKLSLLATPDLIPSLSQLLLRETSTLGVRYVPWQRYKAGRRIRVIKTPWGSVRVKEKILGGQVITRSPEYEDCAHLAREANVPLAEVYEAAGKASRK